MLELPLLVVMIGRRHFFGARQSSPQLIWIMNQNGQMLGADPELRTAVLQRNQWDLFGSPVASQTNVF